MSRLDDGSARASASVVEAAAPTPAEPVEAADEASTGVAGRLTQWRLRPAELAPHEYQGGTASISNLGMFGIDHMIPVINPPQALILGVAAGVEQPWKVGDGVGLATIMAATGSFDHRAIDGAVGARFMAAFRDLVETPLRVVG